MIRVFDSRPGDANFRPQAGHEDVLAARGFDGFAKTRIIPRIHGGPLDNRLTGKDVEQLRPDITAEALRLDGREHGGHIEFLRHAREEHDVVDHGGPVRTGHSEGHLRLLVNEHDGGIGRRVEFVILAHGFVLWVSGCGVVVAGNVIQARSKIRASAGSSAVNVSGAGSSVLAPSPVASATPLSASAPSAICSHAPRPGLSSCFTVWPGWR